MAAVVQTEDLANTPAERAAALARQAAGEPKQDRPLTGAERFAEAETIELGGAGHIIICGAGLVGSLCAVVLLQKGFKVHVFERYQDIRSIPSVGRSINLSVTSRGLRAIRALGDRLAEEVLSITTKVMGRIIHPSGGDTLFQRYGKDDSECNFSISRVELNRLLINAAQREGAEFHFNHGLSDTSDFSGDGLGSTLHFLITNPGAEARHLRVQAACPVIACDGAGSRVRYALRSAGLTTFEERMMEIGYKEVLFPKPAEGQDFGARASPNSEVCNGRFGLHIWPRGKHFLMALANVDGSFTGTIYMEKEGNESFATFSNDEDGRARCRAWCEEHYANAIPHVGGIDELVRQITENPLGILGTVFCDRWAVGSKALLIGDSAHAMVPFFGQGCNCGFEDTLWLSRLIDEHCCEGGRATPEKCTHESFSRVFAAVEAERKQNATAICQMAIENYAEMGSKTGNVTFRAMKKVENRIENAFPLKFRSRYAMVCYGGDGNVSYANAQKLGSVQDAILSQLCTEMDGLNEDILQQRADAVDLGKALELIEEQLAPLHHELGIDLSTVKH